MCEKTYSKYEASSALTEFNENDLWRMENRTCPQHINSNELWPKTSGCHQSLSVLFRRIYDSPIFSKLPNRFDAMITHALRLDYISWLQSDSQEACGGVKCLLQWQINAAWLLTILSCLRLHSLKREHYTLWSWITVSTHVIINSQKWVSQVQWWGSKPPRTTRPAGPSLQAQTSVCEFVQEDESSRLSIT